MIREKWIYVLICLALAGVAFALPFLETLFSGFGFRSVVECSEFELWNQLC